MVMVLLIPKFFVSYQLDNKQNFFPNENFLPVEQEWESEQPHTFYVHFLAVNLNIFKLR